MKRAVELILTAAESYLPGDFVVHRALPRREIRRVGGFVFLDHFDQPNITPELFDVPPHPHVGLQTVTYLFEGEILHTDSLGNQLSITPGDVNWMTAGRGITHAEQVMKLLPRIHGVQSWVGLPHDDRGTAPAFEHFSKLNLPKVAGENFGITVIAGRCEDRDSPIPTFQDLVYLDVSAETGASYEIPVDASHELAVYVCEGSILVGSSEIKRHDLAKLTPGDSFGFTADSKARFILLGGEPLPEPTVIYWNFITDTIEEARQCEADWIDGKFPAVEKYRKISSAGDDELSARMKLL